MSLLTCIQRAASRVRLSVPTAVATSTDPQVLQLLACANEDGQELAQRHRWQALTREATHTTLAAELQGTLESITGAANGFNYILTETMWDRTNDRPLIPISSEGWQRDKANALTGTYSQRYRFRGDSLYAMPAPDAGDTWAFEYLSKYWVRNAADSARSDYFSNDSDVSLLNENIITMGVIWRFKQIKGFDFGPDQQKYEALVADAIARDLPSPRLNMSEPWRIRYPLDSRYNLPEGNF